MKEVANFLFLSLITVAAWFAFWSIVGASVAVARLGYESMFWWLGK